MKRTDLGHQLPGVLRGGLEIAGSLLLVPEFLPEAMKVKAREIVEKLATRFYALKPKH